MTKLVLLGLLSLAAWLAWRSVQRRGPGPGPRPTPAKGGAAPEPVVACAVCGLHVPRSAACQAAERVYCSAAHRDEGERQRAAPGP